MSAILVPPPASNAQSDCGIADAFTYPIDTQRFRLVQDYNVPSPRHQGRVHTGEDWYAGRNISAGEPVRAAANGRVSYAYTQGWGRDGGVVIIQHTLPDGSIVYTQYGHITETVAIQFPSRLACVSAGQIIGAIADARPAPHLHFEVRVSNGDTPGPGYVRGNPADDGWRDPGKFITNQQTWLSAAHVWHVVTGGNTIAAERGPEAPPLVLNDNSLLYLDRETLRRATNDGRVLWRIRLEKPAVAITAYQGAPLLTFADGTMQFIDPDGFLGDFWRVPEVEFAAAPIVVDSAGWLLFPTTNDELVAINESRRSVLWRIPNVPPFVRWHIAGTPSNFIIGLLTVDDELFKISGSGVVIERVPLRQMADFATDRDGRTLLAYTKGGLWRLSIDAAWDLLFADVPTGNSDSRAALMQADGRLLLFDGQTLHAYDADNDRLWQAGLLNISGLVDLTAYDDLTLLTSTGGNIAVINTGGLVCAQTRIFGRPEARQWHDLGDDGILRVAIADQILGLDWARFTRGCQ